MRTSCFFCVLAGLIAFVGENLRGQQLKDSSKSVGLIDAPLRRVLVDSSNTGEMDWPQYESNPFVFPVPEPVFLDEFFVVDVNADGLMDFTYRSETKLFVFDHYGALLWSADIENPRTDIIAGNNQGTGHAAADVDGDGAVEIVALDRANTIVIYDGGTGAIEQTISLPIIGSNNKWVHIAVANLRGNGDRDVILQTMDTSGTKEKSKINRNLLAWDLESNLELWRVLQDDDHTNGTYEGYWGVGHGSFQCADIDEDGRDEVVGGNLVDDDGTLIDLGYPTSWVNVRMSGSTDHFDGISIGDFRPDLPGLEWLLTEEEDHGENNFHTTLMSRSGIIWRHMTTLFTGSAREPQNIAAGDFDMRRGYCEVFIRSRFSGPDSSQHPWLFDAFGMEFADYATEDVLPPGFNANAYGNKEGIEEISTIDWFGGSKHYLAAKARHVKGNIGIFDAVTGEAIWHTVGSVPAAQASLVYVADISGDAREEIIINDANGTIAVYWNAAINTNPSRPRKWDDPLYRRTKQNWNYYSPNGYINTATNPQITLITPDRGERWAAGSTHEIFWSASSEIANVTLQYSTDAAQSWNTIIDSTANDGAYSWTLPETISAQCLVRIANAIGGDPLDVSDAFFSITVPPPVLRVNSFTPGNGVAGVTVTISGENFGGVTSVHFNGVPATTFEILSSEHIAAKVPDEATTGKVSVTTPDTTTLSATDFFVFERMDVGTVFRLYGEEYLISPAADLHSDSKDNPPGHQPKMYDASLRFESLEMKGAVRSATLRLYVGENGDAGSNVCVEFNNNFDSITSPAPDHGNAKPVPARSLTFLKCVDAVHREEWAEFEVTPAIDGDSVYNFVVRNLALDLNYRPYAEMKKPELVIHVVPDSPNASSEMGLMSSTATLPQEFVLYQNTPNPFNPETRIAYDISETAQVSLAIYDVLGREVARLVEAQKSPGHYSLSWSGRRSDGRRVSSGIYFCRLQAGSFVATRKMLFLQ